MNEKMTNVVMSIAAEFGVEPSAVLGGKMLSPAEQRAFWTAVVYFRRVFGRSLVQLAEDFGRNTATIATALRRGRVYLGTPSGEDMDVRLCTRLLNGDWSLDEGRVTLTFTGTMRELRTAMDEWKRFDWLERSRRR